MSWLVVGAGGMLGTDLLAALGDRTHVALTRAELDITDGAAVRAAVTASDGAYSPRRALGTSARLQPSASQMPTPTIRLPAMRLSQRAFPRRCNCSLNTLPPWA